MGDIMMGAAAIGLVAILLMVLALQIQMRTMAHKVDDILSKLGS